MITLQEDTFNDIIDNDNVEDLIKFYKENGLRLDYKNEEGLNVAFFAALNNCSSIFSYLIDNNIIESDFLSPDNCVRVAVEERNDRIIELAINHFNKDSQAQDFILSFILKNNYVEALSLFKNINFAFVSKVLKSNLTAEQKDSFILQFAQQTDIHKGELVSSEFEDIGSLSIQHNCANTLNYLIENEYMFSQYNQFEDLLSIAVDNHSFSCVSQLMEAGLTLSKEQILKCTEYVSQTFDKKLLDLLRQDVYFATFANKNGENNLLLLAIKNGNHDLIDWCLDKKVNINCVDEDDANALILAIENSDLDTVKKLKDRNINLGSKDTLGNTALLLAVSKDEEEIVQLLTENSSAAELRVNDKNNYDVDSISLAIHRKNYAILSSLFFLAPRLHFKDLSEAEQFNDYGNDFSLEMHDLEADKWRVDGLDALSRLGYNFNVKNALGQNIINCYCRNSHSVIDISNLLDVGADIYEKDNESFDSVEVCIIKGFAEKLNVILMKRNYDFEEKRLLSLLEVSAHAENIIKVLLQQPDFVSTDTAMILLTDIVKNQQVSLERYVPLKDLSTAQKGELLVQSVLSENHVHFSELLNDLDKNDVPQELHMVYKQSSDTFKKEHDELYTSLFKVNRLKIK